MSLRAQRSGLGSVRWAELVASASVVHEQALARLELPALILDLPSRVIRAANHAAADLLAVPVPEMIGRDGTEVVVVEDMDVVMRTLQLLSSGGINGYRARRRITTRDGDSRELRVWCRAIELDGVRSAVFFLGSAGTSDGTSLRRLLPVLALESLVVGTADRGWLVERVSADVPDVLGWERDECVGRALLADMHPDDIGDLVRVTESAAVDDTVARRLRLRHRDGSWVPVQFLVVRLTDDRPPRIAFALLPDQVDTADSSADRVTDLEARLRRIAAEVRAAGVIEEIDRLPAPGEHPQLDELTGRQWEILVRLLRGDRVPTIAEELHVSPSTVRNHLTAIFSRFEVHSQAELLALLRPRWQGTP